MAAHLRPSSTPMADGRGSQLSPSRGGGVAPVSGLDPARAGMAQSLQGATLRKLFGGAMECLLPAAYIDVSDLRQVPDHQEVFVNREDETSIVIEVVSFEADVASEESGASARHFFDDLATANGAASSVCDFVADLTDSIIPALASYSKAALAGRQTVVKFRGGAPPEAVRLYLVNVRLPNVGTDLLITVNVPYPDERAAANSMASAECFVPVAQPNASISEKPSSSGASQGVPDTPGDTEKSGAAGVEGRPVSGESDVGVDCLRTLLQSFAILDWSLFC